jgi:hypothetical protein
MWSQSIHSPYSIKSFCKHDLLSLRRFKGFSTSLYERLHAQYVFKERFGLSVLYLICPICFQFIPHSTFP